MITTTQLCAPYTSDEDVLRFTGAPCPQVIFGQGVISQIGQLAATLGRKALLVTDSGIVQAGHAECVEKYLRDAGLNVTTVDDTCENPTTEDVDRCVERAKEAKVDVIIGLGGGSSMDTAKGCNFLYSNGGQMKDYWGVGKATKQMFPFIAIPTTAGTGSECQSFALIADAETHQKMACGDRKAAARMAILDPELTMTQPRLVTAYTGIDALAHAIETAVTKNRNAVSETYSKIAFQLLNQGFEEVFDRPENLESRARMQLGAAYAGTAIENSMLGAAHSAANPLTAHFGLVHGEAVGVMLPHVIHHNASDPEIAKQYAKLFDGDLGEHFTQLFTKAGLRTSLSTHGVMESMIPGLAKEAAGQWTAQFNPVAVEEADFVALYTAAL